jgi:hypothetical protein
VTVCRREGTKENDFANSIDTGSLGTSNHYLHSISIQQHAGSPIRDAAKGRLRMQSRHQEDALLAQSCSRAGWPAVQVNYDASQICHRQTIRDLHGVVHPARDQLGNLVLGHVTWEVGVVSDLPLEYGILTYSGYQQPGSQETTVDVPVQVVPLANMYSARGVGARTGAAPSRNV